MTPRVLRFERINTRYLMENHRKKTVPGSCGTDNLLLVRNNHSTKNMEH